MVIDRLTIEKTMNLLQKYLNEARESGRFVDVYRDNHDDSARFCRIDKVTEYCVLATRINDHGEYDGISVFCVDHITRLRWGGTDREAQSKLAARTGPLPAAPNIDLTTLPDIVQSVHHHFGYVNVAIEEIDRGICFIGEVMAVDDDHLVLHEYGPMEALDRSMLVLNTKEITKVEADGKYERDILYLHQSS